MCAGLSRLKALARLIAAYSGYMERLSGGKPTQTAAPYAALSPTRLRCSLVG